LIRVDFIDFAFEKTIFEHPSLEKSSGKQQIFGNLIPTNTAYLKILPKKAVNKPVWTKAVLLKVWK
jgi:hypothetical protein